jgi:hypothetical protein
MTLTVFKKEGDAADTELSSLLTGQAALTSSEKRALRRKPGVACKPTTLKSSFLTLQRNFIENNRVGRAGKLAPFGFGIME